MCACACTIPTSSSYHELCVFGIHAALRHSMRFEIRTASNRKKNWKVFNVWMCAVCGHFSDDRHDAVPLPFRRTFLFECDYSIAYVRCAVRLQFAKKDNSFRWAFAHQRLATCKRLEWSCIYDVACAIHSMHTHTMFMCTLYTFRCTFNPIYSLREYFVLFFGLVWCDVTLEDKTLLLPPPSSSSAMVAAASEVVVVVMWLRMAAKHNIS